MRPQVSFIIIDAEPEPAGEEPTEEYVRMLKYNLQQYHAIVKALIEDRRTQLLRKNAELARINIFQEGARVMLKDPRAKTVGHRAGSQEWDGPYRILRRVGEVTYEIRREDSPRAKKQIVHISRLKPYSDNKETPETPSVSPETPLPQQKSVPYTLPSDDIPRIPSVKERFVFPKSPPEEVPPEEKVEKPESTSEGEEKKVEKEVETPVPSPAPSPEKETEPSRSNDQVVRVLPEPPTVAERVRQRRAQQPLRKSLAEPSDVLLKLLDPKLRYSLPKRAAAVSTPLDSHSDEDMGGFSQ
jgi:hypothetical protein